MLASSSRQFKAKFLSGMKDTQEKEIFVENTDGEKLWLFVNIATPVKLNVCSNDVCFPKDFFFLTYVCFSDTYIEFVSQNEKKIL